MELHIFRVWTGLQGKGLELVDHLGGLDTAIEVARDLIDANDVEVKAYKTALDKTQADEALKKRLVEAGVDNWTFKNSKDVLSFKARAGADLIHSLPGLDDAITEEYTKLVSSEYIGLSHLVQRNDCMLLLHIRL